MILDWFKKKSKDVPKKPFGKKEPLNKLAVADKDKVAQSSGETTRVNIEQDKPDTREISQAIVSNEMRIGRLGEVLLKYNTVSREDLEKALNIQKESAGGKKKLGEILIENNFITEEQLLSAFARHCRIPYIKINKYGVSHNAVKAIPEELIIKYKVLPIDKIGSVLIMAVLDPYDTNAIKEIGAKTGLKVKTILCKRTDFMETVKFYYPDIKNDAFGGEINNLKPEESKPENQPPVEDNKKPIISETHLSEETVRIKVEEIPFPEPPQPEELENAKEETQPECQKTVIPQTQEPEPVTPESVQDIAEPTSASVEKQVVADVPCGTSINSTNPDGFSEREPGTGKLSRRDVTPEQDLPITLEPEQVDEPADKEITAVPEETPKISETEYPPDDIKNKISEENQMSLQDSVVAESNDEQDTGQPDENIQPETPDQPATKEEKKETEEQISTELTDDTCLLTAKELLINQQPSSEEQIEVIEDAVALEDEDIPILSPEEDSTEKPEGVTVFNKDEPLKPPVVPDSKDKVLSPATKENNSIVVGEDEFMMAIQFLSAQSTRTWEQKYHRGKPMRAEKVDETEFAFYTENSPTT